MELYFFDPKEEPYGPLSNNFVHPITIDKNVWKTVSHYAYAQTLCTPSDKNIISRQLTRDVKKVASELYGDCIQNMTIESMEKAMRKKFRNPFFRKILLGTGDAKLVYNSENEILGKGLNSVGKFLEKLRSEFRDEEKEAKEHEEKQQEYSQIYEIYTAQYILNTLMDRYMSDLSEFIGKTPEEIVVFYGKVEGIPDDKTIYKLYQEKRLSDETIRDINDELKNPGNLANKIRGRKIKKYKEGLQQKIRDYVFDQYTTQLLKVNFPKITNINLAKEQQFGKLSDKEFESLKIRVYSLYEAGKINGIIQENIKRLFPPIPAEIKEEEREEEIVVVPEEEIVVEEKSPDKVPEEVGGKFDDLNIIQELMKSPERKDVLQKDWGPPIVFFDPNEELYGALSPLYSNMLLIDNFFYPSVSHYIICSLFTLQNTVKNYANAHALILIDPEGIQNDISNYISIPELDVKYRYLRDRDFGISLVNGMKEISKRKFMNSDLQSLLVATGDSLLIFADYSDPILGIGKEKRGVNATGLYLMELRRELKEQGVVGEIVERHVRNLLYEKFQSSEKLLKWFNMRTSDICRSIVLFSEYVSKKFGKKKEIDYPLAQFVIENIYNPCGVDLHPTIHTVPKEFSENVEKELGNKKAINLVWRYMSVLTYQLVLSVIWKKVQKIKKSDKEEITSLAKAKGYTKRDIVSRDIDQIGELLKPKEDEISVEDIESEIDGIKELLLNSVKICPGPFPSSEMYYNCVLSAILNLLIVLKNYHGKGYNVSRADIDFIFSIINPYTKGESAPINDEKNILISGFLNIKNEELVSLINGFLTQLGNSSTTEEGEKRVSRVVFFTTLLDDEKEQVPEQVVV